VSSGLSAPPTGTHEPGSDEALLAAFLAGDGHAFDTLVTRYERRVYAICHRYFRNAADAEDAMQDAFVALLRRGGTFAGTSSFSTWMYRVATNACNDLARKRRRRPQRDDTDVEALGDERASAPGVEDALAASSLGPELVAALRTLEPEHREAVVLHDVYGLGYAEIAERSGAAVGTVKSRIHRAHSRLASTLTAAGDPPPGEPSPPARPPTG
jgi:RNA polymerase sigma-70 factor (ECF subfamily)